MSYLFTRRLAENEYPMICRSVFDSWVRESGTGFAGLVAQFDAADEPRRAELRAGYGWQTFWTWEPASDGWTNLVGQRLGRTPVTLLSVGRADSFGSVPVVLRSLEELGLQGDIDVETAREGLEHFRGNLRHAGNGTYTCSSQAQMLSVHGIEPYLFDPAWPARQAQLAADRVKQNGEPEYIDLADRAWQGGSPGSGRRA